MDQQTLTLAVSIAALLIAALGLAYGGYALIRVVGIEKSTHRVTFFDPNTQEFTKPLSADDKANLEKSEEYDNIR